MIKFSLITLLTLLAIISLQLSSCTKTNENISSPGTLQNMYWIGDWKSFENVLTETTSSGRDTIEHTYTNKLHYHSQRNHYYLLDWNFELNEDSTFYFETITSVLDTITADTTRNIDLVIGSYYVIGDTLYEGPFFDKKMHCRSTPDSLILKSVKTTNTSVIERQIKYIRK